MKIQIIEEGTTPGSVWDDFTVWGQASIKDGNLLVTGSPPRKDTDRSFCETFTNVTLQGIHHSMFELRAFQMAPSGTGELPKQFRILIRFT